MTDKEQRPRTGLISGLDTSEDTDHIITEFLKDQHGTFNNKSFTKFF